MRRASAGWRHVSDVCKGLDPTPVPGLYWLYWQLTLHQGAGSTPPVALGVSSLGDSRQSHRSQKSLDRSDLRRAKATRWPPGLECQAGRLELEPGQGAKDNVRSALHLPTRLKFEATGSTRHPLRSRAAGSGYIFLHVQDRTSIRTSKNAEFANLGT